VARGSDNAPVSLERATRDRGVNRALNRKFRCPEEAKVVLWFIALLLFALPCLAAPPPDADPDGPLHAWFEHQHSIAGSWCCKVADGHILAESDWRASSGHYEVWINRTWRPVPATALRDPVGGANPTGHAVVWWTRAGNETVILCFAPGSEL
jgi:hypothetical protein